MADTATHGVTTAATKMMAAGVMENATVAAVVERFEHAGFELYLVGGSVRDLLAGEMPADLDFTTNATVDEFESLLEGLGTVFESGRRYGTLAVSFGKGPDDKVEITTYRAEQYDPDSRKPQVTFGEDLQADLSRRDFTVNAMALDLSSGTLVDPFNGRQDLRDGVLRTPGDADQTMIDDPLRMVRAVRFAALREWVLDESLVFAIRRHRERLSIVARERVTSEMVKVLSAGSDVTNRALRVATDVGVADTVFGKLAKSHKQAQGSGLVECVASLLAGASADEVEACGRALVLPTSTTRSVVELLQAAESLQKVRGAADARRVARRFASQTLMQCVVAGGDTTEAGLRRVEAVEAAEPQLREPLPVNGHDVQTFGFKGPEIGSALRKLEEVRTHTSTMSREAALRALERLREETTRL